LGTEEWPTKAKKSVKRSIEHSISASRSIVAKMMNARMAEHGAKLNTLEEALISVWKQTLVEGARAVSLDGKRYSVRHTPRKGLCQVDFKFDAREFRGLEQNPETSSRWAKLAREGHSVMQFLSEGQYFANVVDGKVTLYKRSS
jgi:hypothetical protein